MRKKATALKYDVNKSNAPIVTAKGVGKIAERIEALAKEHGIEIKEDKDLVEVLMTLDLYEEIPVELYKAVAQILTEIYSINKKYAPN